MQPLITKILFGVLFGGLFLSCNINSSKNVVQVGEGKKNKCFLIQEFVSLGNQTFEPYLEEYSSFMKDTNRFDMLIRVIGQNSKVIRITNLAGIEDELVVKTLTGNTEIEKHISFDVEGLIDKMSKSSKLYHCNTGTSDLGTEIYLLKIDRKLVLKIWVENGNYAHLIEGNELIDSHLNILEDLLSMI